MSHLQKPYANFLEAKTLDSQGWKIYALLAIFRPFFRIVWPLDRRPFQITRTSCMKIPDDVASFWVGITERTINITKYSLCIIEIGVHLASQVNNGEILGVHIFTRVTV